MLDLQLEADVAQIKADSLALTHEDIEALYAREGYGCKSCDVPTSKSWWRGEGDIYCLACKLAMRGLAKFTKVARRGRRIDRVGYDPREGGTEQS